MGKSTNFNGQPVFNQLLSFLDKTEIKAIGKKHHAERYAKKFNTYNHVVVMLFVAFESYHLICEVILGLLANSNKLSHLGLSYSVKRGTFSDDNEWRSSKVFEDIYKGVYRRHNKSLGDSELSDKDIKGLFRNFIFC